MMSMSVTELNGIADSAVANRSEACFDVWPRPTPIGAEGWRKPIASQLTKIHCQRGKKDGGRHTNE